MTKPVIVTREGKGSPLTRAELDANFSNIDDATLGVSDGTNSGSLSLNDTLNFAASGSATVAYNSSTKTITVGASGGGGSSSAYYDMGTVTSGTITPDYTNGNLQKVVIGNTSNQITITPPTNMSVGNQFSLFITCGIARQPALPPKFTNIVMEKGSNNSRLSTVPSTIDRLDITTDGTNYYGILTKNISVAGMNYIFPEIPKSSDGVFTYRLFGICQAYYAQEYFALVRPYNYGSTTYSNMQWTRSSDGINWSTPIDLNSNTSNFIISGGGPLTFACNDGTSGASGAQLMAIGYSSDYSQVKQYTYNVTTKAWTGPTTVESSVYPLKLMLIDNGPQYLLILSGGTNQPKYMKYAGGSWSNLTNIGSDQVYLGDAYRTGNNVVLVVGQKPGTGNFYGVVAVSQNAGTSWTSFGQFNGATSYFSPSAVVSNTSHRWVVAGYNGSLYPTVTVSTNDGSTWTTPTAIVNQQLIPTSIVWNQSLNLFYLNCRTNDNTGNYYMTSSDGITWSSPIKLGTNAFGNSSAYLVSNQEISTCPVVAIGEVEWYLNDYSTQKGNIAATTL
jgi:hypothetical protein